MKKIYTIATLAIAILIVAALAGYAYDTQQQTQTCQTVISTNQQTCCPAAQTNTSCQNPGNCQYPYTGAGPCELNKCGTFCSAGQAAPGWPYGFKSEYWLRPDSNF